MAVNNPRVSPVTVDENGFIHIAGSDSLPFKLPLEVEPEGQVGVDRPLLTVFHPTKGEVTLASKDIVTT